MSNYFDPEYSIFGYIWQPCLRITARTTPESPNAFEKPCFISIGVCRAKTGWAFIPSKQTGNYLIFYIFLYCPFWVIYLFYEYSLKKK